MEDQLNQAFVEQDEFGHPISDYSIVDTELDVANCIVIDHVDEYAGTEQIITGVDEFIGSKGPVPLDKTDNAGYKQSKVEEQIESGQSTSRPNEDGSLKSHQPLERVIVGQVAHESTRRSNEAMSEIHSTHIHSGYVGFQRHQHEINFAANESDNAVPMTGMARLGSVPVGTQVPMGMQMPIEAQMSNETHANSFETVEMQIPIETRMPTGKERPVGTQVAIDTQMPSNGTQVPTATQIPIGTQMPSAVAQNDVFMMRPMFVVCDPNGMHLMFEQMESEQKTSGNLVIKTWPYNNDYENDTQHVCSNNSPIGNPLTVSEQSGDAGNVNMNQANGFNSDTVNITKSVGNEKSGIVQSDSLCQNGTVVEFGRRVRNGLEDIPNVHIETSASVSNISEQSISKMPAQCTICKNRYQYLSDLRFHEKMDHEQSPSTPSPFLCPICSNGFATRIAVRRHVEATHRSEIESAGFEHKCNRCQFAFAKLELLEKHVRFCRDHEDLLQTMCPCPFCGMYFSNRDQQEFHITTVHNSNINRCSICFKVYTNRISLLNHKANMHASNADTPYECDRCPLAFETRSQLVQHNKWHSPFSRDLVDWKFECPYCQVKVPSKYYREKHIATVHGKSSELVVVSDGSIPSINDVSDGINDQNDVEFGDIVSQTQVASDQARFQEEQSFTYNDLAEAGKLHSDKLEDTNVVIVDNRDSSDRVACGSDQPAKAERLKSSVVHDLYGFDIDNHDTPTGKYECTHCNISFVYKRHLQIHMQDVHATLAEYHPEEAPELAEDECTNGEKQNEAVTSARRKSQLLYSCRACKKFTTSDRIELMQHAGECLGRDVGTIKCDGCERFFKSKPALIQHKRFAHKKRVNMHAKCEHCSASVKTKADLALHNRLMHKAKGGSLIKCKYMNCSASFETKIALIEHHRVMHERKSGTMLIECKYCSAPFSGMNMLLKHESICPLGRSEQKKEEDKICRKSHSTFANDDDFRMHKLKSCRKKTFSEKRKQKCAVPEIKRNLRNRTEKNVITHVASKAKLAAMDDTPESPHHCKICHKIFKSTHYVKVHERVHKPSNGYNLRTRRNTHVTNLNKRFTKSHVGDKAKTKTTETGKQNGSQEKATRNYLQDAKQDDPGDSSGDKVVQANVKGKMATEHRRCQMRLRSSAAKKEEELKYNCVFCDDMFQRRSVLKRHLQSKHMIRRKAQITKIVKMGMKSAGCGVQPKC